jgi:hypothetical protein
MKRLHMLSYRRHVLPISPARYHTTKTRTGRCVVSKNPRLSRLPPRFEPRKIWYRPPGDGATSRRPCAGGGGFFAFAHRLVATASWFRRAGLPRRLSRRRPRAARAGVKPTQWTVRASGLQVRDPHNGDYGPIIDHVLFCPLVAGPDEILLGRNRLAVLHHPKLTFGDMADHGVWHYGVLG